MAAFSVIGFVDGIKPIKGACLLYLSEFKKGYRKADGERVEDRYNSWKIIFKEYFQKYLLDHFGKGMLVEVKGEIFPYAVEHNKAVEGVSILGQTCNLFSYPRSDVKQELKMMRESQDAFDEKPNLEEFMKSDF